MCEEGRSKDGEGGSIERWIDDISNGFQYMFVTAFLEADMETSARQKSVQVSQGQYLGENSLRAYRSLSIGSCTLATGL
nr:hypothetical protein CFP56_21322 [Quercus suber]